MTKELQMAVEALRKMAKPGYGLELGDSDSERADYWHGIAASCRRQAKEIADSLEAAIQQQPEPVAIWQSCFTRGGGAAWSDCSESNARAAEERGYPCRVLYTSPPALQQKEEPSGLSDEQVTQLSNETGVGERTIRSILDKSARLSPSPSKKPAPAPQFVAYQEGTGDAMGVAMGDCGNAECNWRGPLSACSYVGTVGPCCPECREIVEPDTHGVKEVDRG